MVRYEPEVYVSRHLISNKKGQIRLNTSSIKETVAALGASPKLARFSHKSVVALKEARHHWALLNLALEARGVVWPDSYN